MNGSAWGLAGKFVIGYSGNLGRAHDVEAIFEGAQRLRHDPRIVFIFIGGGRRFDQLAARVRDSHVESTVRFFPYQDRETLRWSLSVPDVHWLSLKPELEGLIFPSKFYGAAAAGRPIIAIAAVDGEIARLVERHGCGLTIDPSHGARLAGVLAELAGDPPRCATLGRRARAMLDANFTRRRAFAQWCEVFDRLA